MMAEGVTISCHGDFGCVLSNHGDDGSGLNSLC